MIEKSNKIIVALSGGVDSAVAAALLKKQGHDAVGVFFRFGKFSNKAEIQARKIAKKLRITLKIVDARNEFRKNIIDYFISSYQKGETPNPCVACNKEMKFRLLFDLLKKYKADFVATGHYARLRREFPISNFQFPNNPRISKFQNTRLFEAKDKSKDQSYFLYKLSSRELSKIIFPLGDYKKTDVIKLGKKMKLPVAKKESQDICFIENSDLENFFKKNIKLEPGNIVNDLGEIMGKHRGLPLYTIGQRKGIEIGGIGPNFVLGKNLGKNELIVTKDSKKLFKKKFEITETNWTNDNLKFPLRAKVQIRYHAEKIPAIIKTSNSPKGGGKYLIETKKPLRAVTPGQSAVFYKDKEVLGGGTMV